MAPHEERSATAPLAHPLFWTALAVLLLNDHILKGAGLLPGSVTGKLSDFAGLIVAPVLLVSALGARRRAARLACFGAVLLVFGAINLSPAAARLLEGALGAMGLEWRIWTDPADLLAFAILPVSWWLLDARRPRVPRLALQRAGALLGVFACIATSEPGPDPGPPIERVFFTTDAFVSNDTGRTIDLRVRWIDAQVDCAAVEGELSRALHADAFGEGVTLQLGPGSIAPLNRAEASRALGITGTLGAAPSGCEIVLVQADSLPATVAFWSGIPVHEVLTGAADVRGSVGALRLEGGTDGLGLTHGSAMLSAPYAAVIDPPTCDPGTPTAFGWSEIPPELEGLLTLEAVDPGPDGCLAADVRTAADVPRRLFFCVPEWAFPFAPGTEIQLSTSPRVGIDTSIEIAGVDAMGAERILYASHDTMTGETLPVTLSGAEIGCEGERLDCGLYAQSRGLMLAGSDEPLLPGDMVDLVPEVHGVSGLLMVGRAAHTVLAPMGCAASPGLATRFDAVVLMEVGL